MTLSECEECKIISFFNTKTRNVIFSKELSKDVHKISFNPIEPFEVSFLFQSIK